MNRQWLKIAAFLAFAWLEVAAPAQAQLFRSYLATTGNDANPCTLPAPCRLLPRALATVANGGEIWMLDSGNFNAATVIVDKSVTILAVPGVMGSLVAPTDTYAIDAAPGITLTLRNLVFRGLTGSGTAVRYVSGAAFAVEDCRLYDLSGGIFMSKGGNDPRSYVTIERSSFRNMQSSAIYVSGNYQVRVEEVQVNHVPNSNDGPALFVLNGAEVNVKRSAFMGVQAGPGIWAWNPNPSDSPLRLTVSDTQLLHNAFGILASSSGVAVEVVLENNTIMHNSIGIQAATTVYTRGNNTVKFNGTDVAGALTPLGGT